MMEMMKMKIMKMIKKIMMVMAMVVMLAVSSRKVSQRFARGQAFTNCRKLRTSRCGSKMLCAICTDSL